MKIQPTTLKLALVILVSLGIGFFAGMEYKAYQVRKAVEDAFGGLSTDVDSDTRAEDQQKSFTEKIEESDEKVIDKSIGDIINLATMDVQANSITENNILTQKYGSPEVAREGAKFVVVSITVTNTTPSAFMYDSGDILVDNKDRTFESVCCTYDDNLVYDDLAPSIKTTGNLVFEVPTDAEGYSLVYRKAGTNEVYKIKLK